jgi:S-adenosylmethionine hydrolase
MHSHISLLTDYGLNDEFVGVMKSVLTDMAPHVRITDLTHGVPAFDVRAGSLALARAVQYVPAGIVIAVVDPGVGSSRRAIAVEVAGGRGIFLGPDNGLLASGIAMAGGADRAFELTNVELHLAAPGTTFAGRDIFAPVAAFLANGGALEDVGNEIDTASVMPGLVPVASDETHASYGSGLRCEVTWVDAFGNCQMNVGPDDIAHFGPVLRLVIGDDVRSARVVSHFADINGGAIGAVIDSYGMVALAVDRGSAAEALRISAGDAVLVFAGEAGSTSSVTLRSSH